MSNPITEQKVHLNLSVKGASHYRSGKPCQDYSLTWASDDGTQRILIVSDGHGSSTYVRSDRGSRLASEIALQSIKHFIATTDARTFIGASGAVTARDPEAGKYPRFVDSETDERIQQQEMFVRQIQGIEPQDAVLQQLFQNIYNSWLEAIIHDAETDPLTHTERRALAGKDLVKAYGATLMAYFETPYYWVAFQIGDGRLLTADRHLHWTQPVPWDYQCYLNITTSLCGYDALNDFRYAFNGTGDFPTAVICCSDGIEDSYGDYPTAPQYLHNFYSGLMLELHNHDITYLRDKLGEFLPVLSEKGSRDDMSIALLANIGQLKTAVEQKQLEAARDQINNEHNEREKALAKRIAEIEKMQKGISEAAASLKTQESDYQSFKEEAFRIIERLRRERDEKRILIAQLRERIAETGKGVSDIQIEIDAKREENRKADEAAIKEKQALHLQYQEIDREIERQRDTDLACWQQRVQQLSATPQGDTLFIIDQEDTSKASDTPEQK